MKAHIRDHWLLIIAICLIIIYLIVLLLRPSGIVGDRGRTSQAASWTSSPVVDNYWKNGRTHGTLRTFITDRGERLLPSGMYATGTPGQG